MATIGPSIRPAASTLRQDGRDAGGSARFGDDFGPAERPHHRLENLVVVDRDHVVGEPADVVERQIARTDRHQPIGDAGGRGQRDRMAGVERRAHRCRADRLDPDHPDFRAALLDRGDAHPPPGPRRRSGRRWPRRPGSWSRISRPTVAWPAMIHSWSNGGTMVRPRAAASVSARARRSADVVPSKITSAPNDLAPSTFTRGAVVGITTTAGAPSCTRGERHRLAVIARRIGDDAALPLVGGQLRDHVVGAANLERAARLHVLALEEQRPPGVRGDVDERRDAAPRPRCALARRGCLRG